MELLRRKIDKYLHDWKMNPSRKPLVVKFAKPEFCLRYSIYPFFNW